MGGPLEQLVQSFGLDLPGEVLQRSMPPLFSEPGLFLVRPNGELYFASVQTMPFARPALADLLGGLDFVVVMIGVFAIGEVVSQVGTGGVKPIRTRMRAKACSISAFHWPNWRISARL